VTFDGKVRILGAPSRSPAPVSTEDRSGAGGSSDSQDEQSRIVLPPETGEQPSLSSGLSDAPWPDRWCPGSLYSIIEYEEEEEEDLFTFNDTIEGPRAPAV
jgi:hypothetical protein